LPAGRRSRQEDGQERSHDARWYSRRERANAHRVGRFLRANILRGTRAAFSQPPPSGGGGVRAPPPRPRGAREGTPRTSCAPERRLSSCIAGRCVGGTRIQAPPPSVATPVDLDARIGARSVDVGRQVCHAIARLGGIAEGIDAPRHTCRRELIERTRTARHTCGSQAPRLARGHVDQNASTQARSFRRRVGRVGASPPLEPRGGGGRRLDVFQRRAAISTSQGLTGRASQIVPAGVPPRTRPDAVARRRSSRIRVAALRPEGARTSEGQGESVAALVGVMPAEGRHAVSAGATASGD
jgi:hypothetical protein